MSIIRYRENGSAPWEIIAAIKGDKGDPGKTGEKGESGVYVGTTAPEDNSLIWIDPEGEPNTNFATMEAVEAKGYQTAAQVQALINTALTGVENGTY